MFELLVERMLKHGNEIPNEVLSFALDVRRMTRDAYNDVSHLYFFVHTNLALNLFLRSTKRRPSSRHGAGRSHRRVVSTKERSSSCRSGLQRSIRVYE